MRAMLDNDNLIFRWDVLHMANRSHISARGSTDVDNANTENDGPTNRHNRQTLLARAMNYLQS